MYNIKKYQLGNPDLSGNYFFLLKSLYARFIILKPNQEHSRGSNQFSNQKCQFKGFFSYDRTHKQTDKQKLLLDIRRIFNICMIIFFSSYKLLHMYSVQSRLQNTFQVAIVYKQLSPNNVNNYITHKSQSLVIATIRIKQSIIQRYSQKYLFLYFYIF